MKKKQQLKILSEVIQIQHDTENLLIILSWDLRSCDCVRIVTEVQEYLTSSIKTIDFIDDGLQTWDSSLLLILYDILRLARHNQVSYDCSHLPQNLQDLLDLAFAVDRRPPQKTSKKQDFLENNFILWLKHNFFKLYVKDFKWKQW